MTSGTTKLSPAVIVAAAIRIADARGLNGLSMRRVADELGVGAMSLYRHVADKEALLLAMSEEVTQRYPYPYEDAPSWQERVRIAVDVDWELYRRHPWVVLAYSSPRLSYGEASLECLDWLSAGFLELGVGIERATDMALTVWSFVHGVALMAVGDKLIDDQVRGESEVPSVRLSDVIAGHSDAAMPEHLARLAGRPDAAHLLDPRARLDTGIGYLCAGFGAAAH